MLRFEEKVEAKYSLRTLNRPQLQHDRTGHHQIKGRATHNNVLSQEIHFNQQSSTSGCRSSRLTRLRAAFNPSCVAC